MQIFVRNLNGSTITIDVESFESVKSLKLKIENKSGVPSFYQEIKYGDKILEDQRNLFDYSITRGSNLNLELGLRGGALLPSFSFNSMSYEVNIPFSVSAPEWCYVYKGISWSGVCKNINCKASNEIVYVSLGFGTFDVRNTISNLKCPICCKKIENVNNCGFSEASWTFKGRDGQGNKLKGNGRTIKNFYSTFKENDEIDWAYLSITVDPLR
jgi:Ubiquitin family